MDNQNINSTNQVLQDPPMLAKLRQIGKSGLFLALVILVTVSVVFSFISELMPQASVSFDINIKDMLGEETANGLNDYFRDVTGEDIISEDGSILAEEKGSDVFSAIISHVLPVISCIGFWLIYSGSRKTGAFSTKGFTMVKVVKMISFVIVDIVLGFLGIVFLICGGVWKEVAAQIPEIEVDPGLITTVFIVLGIVMTLLCAFFIVFTVFFSKAMNGVRETAKTAVPCDGVTKFMAVTLIVLGCISALGDVTSILSIGGIASLCSAAANIIAGLVFLRFIDAHDEVAAPAFYDVTQTPSAV